MAHIERITDVPAQSVDTIRQRMEQRGATVAVIDQGGGLFTIEGTFPDDALGVAAPGDMTALAAPGQLTDIQVRTAKAIVNVFETSEVLGHYGQVTLIPGDTGHLTYGRSQTTLGSGLLHDLLDRYAGNVGSRFGARLRPFLQRTAERDTSLDNDTVFKNLLRSAADDPVMRETQDVFFDTAFWNPAVRAAQGLSLQLPMSTAVVYDGFVHGSWARVRDATIASDGTVQALGERGWMAAYVARRRDWLAHHDRPDLRSTVYRMEAFQRLIDQDRWSLALPLVVRGREISSLTLAGTPPGCYAGPTPGTRALALQAPLARGQDVRLVQLALSDAGLAVQADGVFGQASSQAVRQFQAERGLPSTGAADAAAVAELAGRVFAA